MSTLIVVLLMQNSEKKIISSKTKEFFDIMKCYYNLITCLDLANYN